MTEVEGSKVPRSVWPAVVVVCGGWMVGRLETDMWTRVWTGSCCVAASVVAALAGAKGARDAVGAGSWLGLGLRSGLGQGRFCCCRAFCVFFGLCGVVWVVSVMLLVVVVVVVLLRAVWSFGFQCRFGFEFWVVVRLEVQEDLVSEV